MHKRQRKRCVCILITSTGNFISRKHRERNNYTKSDKPSCSFTFTHTHTFFDTCRILIPHKKNVRLNKNALIDPYSITNSKFTCECLHSFSFILCDHPKYTSVCTRYYNYSLIWKKIQLFCNNERIFFVVLKFGIIIYLHIYLN